MIRAQKGFMVYALLGAAIAIGLLLFALKAQTGRLEAEKKAFSEFKGGVKALGEAAEAAKVVKEAEDIVAKEKADAENAKTTSTLVATIKRLRDANPGRSVLPTAPSGSSRPDLACFDRAEYQRADGIATEKLFTGARGLADEGSKNTVDLDTSKRWANAQ